MNLSMWRSSSGRGAWAWTIVLLGILAGAPLVNAQMTEEESCNQMRDLLFDQGEYEEAVRRVAQHVRQYGFDLDQDCGKSILALLGAGASKVGQPKFQETLFQIFLGKSSPMIERIVDFYSAEKAQHRRWAEDAKDEYLRVISIDIELDKGQVEVRESIGFRLRGYNSRSAGGVQVSGEGSHVVDFANIEVYSDRKTQCRIVWTDKLRGKGRIEGVWDGKCELRVRGTDDRADYELKQARVLEVLAELRLEVHEGTAIGIHVGETKTVTVKTNNREILPPLDFEIEPGANDFVTVTPVVRSIGDNAAFHVRVDRMRDPPLVLTFADSTSRARVSMEVRTLSSIEFKGEGAVEFNEKKDDVWKLEVNTFDGQAQPELLDRLDFSVSPRDGLRFDKVKINPSSAKLVVDTRRGSAGRGHKDFTVTAVDSVTGVRASTTVRIRPAGPSRLWAIVASAATVGTGWYANSQRSKKNELWEEGYLRRAELSETELDRQYNDEIDSHVFRERVFWTVTGGLLVTSAYLWKQYFDVRRAHEAVLEGSDPSSPQASLLVGPSGEVGLSVTF